MSAARPSRIKLLLASAILAAGVGGCGAEETDSTGPVPMGKLPAAVVKAAQKEAPGVAFSSAIEEKVGSRVAFELTGRDAKGKVQKVKVSRLGKILKGG